jgi:DNA-binding NarL/FixJ family response regulator
MKKHVSTARPLVMYVENDARERAELERASGDDYDVATVADDHAAFPLLETRDVAVLVVDVSAPGAGDDLLRTVKQRYPRTIRVAVTSPSNADRIARMCNDGLATMLAVKPWERTKIAELLCRAREAWSRSSSTMAPQHRLSEADRLIAATRTFAHDVRTPLMSILQNAGCLQEFADDVPALRAKLAGARLPKEHERKLMQILELLEPIAQDLTISTRQITALLDTLEPLPPTAT